MSVNGFGDADIGAYAIKNRKEMEIDVFINIETVYQVC
jgi:hypothetical protein